MDINKFFLATSSRPLGSGVLTSYKAKVGYGWRIVWEDFCSFNAASWRPFNKKEPPRWDKNLAVDNVGGSEH
jgi:hypothetical protein